MPGFDETILQDILNRSNIVEIIAEYIPLKRAGRNFKACCPFHHEKTASFIVSSDKQIYHCFGCGVGGNAFNFLMQYERLDFPEVVELLAKKTGVLLPAKRSRDPQAASVAAQIHAVNELALIFYTDTLHGQAGLKAREYLQKRGISRETAKNFRLGFAPDSWDALISFCRSKKQSLSALEKAGLVVTKEGGGYYDRFRNRITFPIFDVKGAVIGFGARVLDASLPKYINSPETAVYTKGKNLYGLQCAKDAIKEQDRAIVVEGNLDCIVPFQHGITNIVASLGTALTAEQARLIKRYTANVVMVYDGDLAGEMATLRSLDIFVEEGMHVRIAGLPGGFDPDSYVRTKGSAAFKALIEKAENLFDYLMRILKTRNDPQEIEGKARICAEMLPMINKFKNAIVRSEYIKRLAEELQVTESALAQEIAKIKEPERFRQEYSAPVKAKASAHPTEKLLMKLMLEENELIASIKDKVDPSDFQDADIARIVSAMFELVGQGKEFHPGTLIQHLGEDALSAVVCESTFMPGADALDKEKIVHDCISRLKKNSIQQKRKRLQEAIRNAEAQNDEETVNTLKIEFNYLIKKS